MVLKFFFSRYWDRYLCMCADEYRNSRFSEWNLNVSRHQWRQFDVECVIVVSVLPSDSCYLWNQNSLASITWHFLQFLLNGGRRGGWISVFKEKYTKNYPTSLSIIISRCNLPSSDLLTSLFDLTLPFLTALLFSFFVLASPTPPTNQVTSHLPTS